MTRNNCFLTNLQPTNQDWVNFKDGGKGRVMGISFFIIPRLSRLKNALLIEGLTINLISVNHYVMKIYLYISQRIRVEYKIKLTILLWKKKGL